MKELLLSGKNEVSWIRSDKIAGSCQPPLGSFSYSTSLLWHPVRASPKPRLTWCDCPPAGRPELAMFALWQLRSEYYLVKSGRRGLRTQQIRWAGASKQPRSVERSLPTEIQQIPQRRLHGGCACRPSASQVEGWFLTTGASFDAAARSRAAVSPQGAQDQQQSVLMQTLPLCCPQQRWSQIYWTAGFLIWRL